MFGFNKKKNDDLYSYYRSQIVPNKKSSKTYKKNIINFILVSLIVFVLILGSFWSYTNYIASKIEKNEISMYVPKNLYEIFGLEANTTKLQNNINKQENNSSINFIEINTSKVATQIGDLNSSHVVNDANSTDVNETNFTKISNPAQGQDKYLEELAKLSKEIDGNKTE